eukprot:g20010.t1
MEISKELADRDLLHVVLHKPKQSDEDMRAMMSPGGVFTQPAVLALTPERSVLYAWSSRPSPANLMGAMSRPRAVKVLACAKQTLLGDPNRRHWRPKEGYDVPPLPIYLFALLTLAHGNFLGLRMPHHDITGQGGGYPALYRAFLKLLLVCSLLALCLCCGSFAARSLALLAICCYAAYALSRLKEWRDELEEGLGPLQDYMRANLKSKEKRQHKRATAWLYMRTC